jgi:uncharacterized membrane-anchored protein
MKLPPDHPQRIELNDEVHARPPEPLTTPSRVSYLALLCDATQGDAGAAAVTDLCRRHDMASPAAGATHFSAAFPGFRLRWERHTEFIRCMFVVEGVPADPFSEHALRAVPADWIATLPGQLMVAAHAALIADSASGIDPGEASEYWFTGNILVGAGVSGGAAVALTDFRLHRDGFSRHLVIDRATTPYQAGRLMQRLLEALLALPVARATTPLLAVAEQELARITAALVTADEADEPGLLDRLTRLEAEIGARQSETRYRFSAATAYHDLVQRRIDELREQRIHGLQTFREFTERRPAPAMATCRSVAARQESLSQRVARATRLLSTRVDLTRERQNQALLASMDRRARPQLRLQSTVEGLSVAAVTYYVVVLIGLAAEALREEGVRLDPGLVMGISISVVAAAALGLHRIRWSVIRPRDH